MIMRFYFDEVTFHKHPKLDIKKFDLKHAKMSATVSVILITTISYFWRRDYLGHHYSRGVTVI